MHAFRRLLLCVVTPVWLVNANVEKTIFVAPSPLHLPNVHPGLDDLRIDTILPTLNPILATKLPVQFPSDAAPRGLESWYLLRGLEEGRRYEVRICWPATVSWISWEQRICLLERLLDPLEHALFARADHLKQPTDFWLDTYTVTHVLDTSELISSLAAYSEQREELGLESTEYLKEDPSPTAQSVLFLRIQAAASYYSPNRTLMEYPPDVDVDIILDPFLLNILPRSLGPVVIYIIIAAIGAWFLSDHIYRWLLSVAAEESPKPHTD